MIKQINQRIDTLINKSNNKIKEKEEILTRHLAQLNAYNDKLITANSQCMTKLNTQNMDKSQRKSDIMDISQGILRKNVNEIEIVPKVDVEMNMDSFISIVGDFGNINDHKYPIKPILNVTNITTSTATVMCI